MESFLIDKAELLHLEWCKLCFYKETQTGWNSRKNRNVVLGQFVLSQREAFWEAKLIKISVSSSTTELILWRELWGELVAESFY